MNDPLMIDKLFFYPSLAVTCMGFLVLLSLIFYKWVDWQIYFVIPMVLSFPWLIISASNIYDKIFSLTSGEDRL